MVSARTTWTHTAPGRGKPGVGRPITEVTHDPAGWYTSGGRSADGTWTQMATCNSVFWLPRAERCANLVTFQVQTTQRRLIYTHYLCAEHFAVSPREGDIFARSLVPGVWTHPTTTERTTP